MSRKSKSRRRARHAATHAPARGFALLGALLFAFGFAAFSTDVADTDSWWHLRTGKYVAETGGLPVPDPFSWTAPNAPEAYDGEARVRRFNLTHEWLAQTVAYGAFSLGGFPLLIALRAASLSMICVAAGWLAWRATGTLPAAAFAGLAPAPVLLLFAADRPAILSFGLVASFVVVLEEYWRRPHKLIWVLPALQWIWMNSHGGAFLGWVVLGIYCVAAIGKRRSERNPLWTVGAISLAISYLNPNGYQHLAILLAYRESYLTETLIEWRPPLLLGPPYWYNVLLYGGVAVLAVSWRVVAFRHALLFLAFGVASLLAFRNLPLLVFVSAFLVAAYGWGHVSTAVERLPRMAGAAVPGVLLAGFVTWRAFATPPALRFGIADWRVPAAAADIVAEMPAGVRIFNTYELGGYLLWRLGPERKVFIDGRALSEVIYKTYRQLVFGTGSDPEELYRQRSGALDDYEIRVIVMNGIEFVSGTIYPLLLELADPAHAEWQLVHADAAAVVFVRASSENRAFLDSHPPIDKIWVLDHLEQACEANIAQDPQLHLCARSLGFLLGGRGERERARAALDLYLSHVPQSDLAAEQARDELMQ